MKFGDFNGDFGHKSKKFLLFYGIKGITEHKKHLAIISIILKNVCHLIHINLRIWWLKTKQLHYTT